jgi:cysteine-S-conjugate beta-lyase
MSYDFDRVIDRLQTESHKWHKYPPDVLPLWVADMDFRSPEPVIRALRERVEHGVFGYGLEQPEFYEVFLDRLQKRYGWRVSRDAILLIPGVIPGFNVACRALTVPGDGLLLQTPMYPPILRVPQNVGLSSDEIELSRQADGRYVIDFDRFEAALRERTRVFLLCNPHNPVGRVYRRDELTRMAEICLRRGLWICADEVHCELTFSGQQHVPIASLDPEIADRTVTLMAPSKTFNLAGLKCSVAIIPNAALREKFVAAQVDMVRAVNILGYTATLAAYRDGQPWLDDLLRYLETNRDLVVEFTRSRLRGVRIAPPEATYLAWLDCRELELPGDDPYSFFLEHARVALNDGQAFGQGGRGFVRLNFGCPRRTLSDALDRMAGAVAGRA